MPMSVLFTMSRCSIQHETTFLAAARGPIFSQDLPNLVASKDADFSYVDAVFCCLAHVTTQVGSFIMLFLRFFSINC